jgi:hypothetical protein
LRRLAIIGDVGYAGSVLEISEVQAAAGKFGLDIDVLEIGAPRILRPLSRRSRAGRRRCTCVRARW